MRPLGRLAVQDHLSALTARFRDRISVATDSDSIAQSAAAESTPFTEDRVDVLSLHPFPAEPAVAPSVT